MKKNKKGFFGEFKEFIMRGNVVDMAVGMVIATAFGAITKALVDKVIMPLVGLIIGGIDLAQLNITLKKAGPGEADKAVVLGLGEFLVTIIDFIIIAFVIFLVVKAMNKAKAIAEAKKKKEEEEPAPVEDPKPTTEELLADILEELKKKK